MTEEESERRRIENELELLRYRRLLRVMVILLIFWFTMLYFIVHHDQGLFIAGICIMAIWIFYMCMCIFGNIFLQFREDHRRNRRRQILEKANNMNSEDQYHDEEEGLTGIGSIVDDVDRKNQGFSYSFEETPRRIKECEEPIVPGTGPTNGTYTSIFSAVYFNRIMRTEGKLRFQFHQQKDTGWQVRGESNFGKESREILEGFVNAKGEMYWKAGNAMHRGILNFESSSIFDGEFVPKGNNGPVGRIVRVELAKAAFYSGSVEMVSFSRDGSDTDENKTQPLFT